MIYIYRTLWLLGWIPLLALTLVLFTITIFMIFPVVAGFYYIKTGNIENTPDYFVPSTACDKIINFYYKLEKIINKQ